MNAGYMQYFSGCAIWFGDAHSQQYLKYIINEFLILCDTK